MLAQERTVLKWTDGHYAESLFRRVLYQTPKVKLVSELDNDKLAMVAYEFSQSKFETVAEWLCHENYGTWANAAPNVLLDKFFKIDAYVVYKGYRIGIDVTINPDAVKDKLSQMQRMSKTYTKLGIDRVAVCLVKGSMNTDIMTQRLNNIIQTKEVTVQII